MMLKKSLYSRETEKKPENVIEIEKNYRFSRCVCHSLFVEVADTFIQYINMLKPNEIEQLDNDLKPNGCGVKSIVEIPLIFGVFFKCFTIKMDAFP